MVKSHEKFVKLVVLHRKVSIFMVFWLRSQMKRRIFEYANLQNESFGRGYLDYICVQKQEGKKVK